MDLQLIPIVLLAAVLLAGGAIAYITRRDSRSHSQAERYLEQLQQAPHPADTRSAARRRHIPAEALSPTDEPSPGTRAVPLEAAPLDGQQLASSLNQHTGVTQDEAAELLRTLRSNQQSMADPNLSTLDRVQALMASSGFAVHLRMSAEQQAAQRDAGQASPQADAERDPRNERGSL